MKLLTRLEIVQRLVGWVVEPALDLLLLGTLHLRRLLNLVPLLSHVGLQDVVPVLRFVIHFLRTLALVGVNESLQDKAILEVAADSVDCKISAIRRVQVEWVDAVSF
jgi:hypothetical protein